MKKKWISLVIIALLQAKQLQAINVMDCLQSYWKSRSKTVKFLDFVGISYCISATIALKESLRTKFIAHLFYENKDYQEAKIYNKISAGAFKVCLGHFALATITFGGSYALHVYQNPNSLESPWYTYLKTVVLKRDGS